MVVERRFESVTKKVDFTIWFMLAMLLIAIVVAFCGVAPPFVWTSTTYSPEYSERRFHRVQIGEPEEQVRAALREPVWRYTNSEGSITLKYSHHDNDGMAFHFHSRMICVSNGVVVEKLSFIDYD